MPPAGAAAPAHLCPRPIYARQIVQLMAGNHPLRIPKIDRETALLNRMVTICFQNPVKESEMRQGLHKDLLDEAPYIVSPWWQHRIRQIQAECQYFPLEAADCPPIPEIVKIPHTHGRLILHPTKSIFWTEPLILRPGDSFHMILATTFSRAIRSKGLLWYVCAFSYLRSALMASSPTSCLTSPTGCLCRKNTRRRMPAAVIAQSSVSWRSVATLSRRRRLPPRHA